MPKADSYDKEGHFYVRCNTGSYTVPNRARTQDSQDIETKLWKIKGITWYMYLPLGFNGKYPISLWNPQDMDFYFL